MATCNVYYVCNDVIYENVYLVMSVTESDRHKHQSCVHTEISLKHTVADWAGL